MIVSYYTSLQRYSNISQTFKPKLPLRITGESSHCLTRAPHSRAGWFFFFIKSSAFSATEDRLVSYQNVSSHKCAVLRFISQAIRRPKSESTHAGRVSWSFQFFHHGLQTPQLQSAQWLPIVHCHFTINVHPYVLGRVRPLDLRNLLFACLWSCSSCMGIL